MKRSLFLVHLCRRYKDCLVIFEGVNYREFLVLGMLMQEDYKNLPCDFEVVNYREVLVLSMIM